MRAFEYFEPKTVGEATKYLTDLGETARILAGGVDLIPRMRKEEFKTDYVVNIQRIEGLDRIDYESGKGLRFGAFATLHALEVSGWVRKGYPAFYEAIHQIASVQTKYMGTAVGNLCVGTPASDVATALYAHGASLSISGPEGERIEPIQDFCTDYRCTSLKRGEMVTGVSVPPMKTGETCGFANLVRTRADIAKLTVPAGSGDIRALLSYGGDPHFSPPGPSRQNRGLRPDEREKSPPHPIRAFDCFGCIAPFSPPMGGHQHRQLAHQDPHFWHPGNEPGHGLRLSRPLVVLPCRPLWRRSLC